MGELILQAPVAGLTSRNKVTAEDVIMLRQEVFRDGVVSRGEAEALFAVDRTCANRCPEWTEFFVEAVTDYIVRQEEPVGYISEDNAAWLIRAVTSDGLVDTAGELEILIKSLEIAHSAPAELAAFALRQVAAAVLDGKGALANGENLTPGVIGSSEVEVLRRILHAGGGENGTVISRSEAEVLFDLNDRTSESANSPEWNDLFMKAVANMLMCASGYTPPSREEALAREQFFADTDVDVGGFMKRMVSGGLTAIINAYTAPSGLEETRRDRNETFEMESRAAEKISADEARWLAERIGRDGVVHNNEQALLNFIRNNSPDIHPDLKPLLDKAS